jgi:PqqD family protein of HPr-rel-A system
VVDQVWRASSELVTEAVDEDGFAVFDRQTGMTHFLSDLPVLVLDLLQDGGKTFAQLVEAVAEAGDLDPGSIPRETLARTLSDLAKAELVTSARIDGD